MQSNCGRSEVTPLNCKLLPVAKYGALMLLNQPEPWRVLHMQPAAF